MVIFSSPFEWVNFSRGIVRNFNQRFGKDAAYDFLKNPKHNWRKFMLAIAAIVVRFIDVLTGEERGQVLIFDDFTYDRSRSKAVELLARIYDHNIGRNLKGFKLVTLGWSDGNSFGRWTLSSVPPMRKRDCKGSLKKWIMTRQP